MTSKTIRALMRGIPNSLNDCQHQFQSPTWIDIGKAKHQHDLYRQTLESLGVSVDLLPADDAFPDCCFVEDTAVLIDDTAVICWTGAASRRGEVDAVRKHFAQREYTIIEMAAPAELDGGDVLQIRNELFVGLSHRTNLAGFEMLAQVAERHGRTASPIKVREALHLKTACTYLGRGAVIGSLNALGEGRSLLERFQIWPVDQETDAANVCLVNDHVLISAQCERTAERLAKAGFQIIPVDISELHKAEAGLTCLSILEPP